MRSRSPSVMSPVKLNQAGFTKMIDTEASIVWWLERLQRERWLPPMAKGEVICSACLTEPGGGAWLVGVGMVLCFGLLNALGITAFGRAEVIWPGGVRNRLYGVSAYERITFPEIPCGYDASWNTFGEYAACVNEALDDLHGAGVLTIGEKIRLKISAVIAYFDMHP